MSHERTRKQRGDAQRQTRDRGQRMTQPGQHVVTIDKNASRRRIIGYVRARAGHRGAIARQMNDAIAMRRPALHPFSILLSASMRADGDDGSALLPLLVNSDVATTPALARANGNDAHATVEELREEVARLGPAMSSGQRRQRRHPRSQPSRRRVLSYNLSA